MQHYGSGFQKSPIARKQAALRAAYGWTHFGAFGLTSSEGGAAKGASTGASVGSVVPIIGTAVGAILGAVGGAIFGSMNKKDPENFNFDQAVAMWNANRMSVLNIANKYLVLAGLFDLNIHTNIPIYKKYGHMGEQRFVTDMMTLIYQAAQKGKIGPNDTATTIMANVVQPWIDSWGFGPMADPHADLINLILLGMIAEYIGGQQTRWLARGGDYPFASLPKFALGPAGGNVSVPSAQQNAPAPAGGISQSTQPATLPLPATILSNDGSVATPGSNTGLRVPSGAVFYFGPSPTASGDYPIYVNGQPNGPAAAIGLVLLHGQLYQKNLAGNWWVWVGSNGWNPTSDPTNATSTGGTQTAPAQTTVPIPAGFTVAATDSATGLPVYSTPNGGYYTWNGATMTPYTGTLTGGVQVSAGTVVPSATPSSLTTGSQQLYNSQAPAPAPDYSQYAPAPAGGISQNAPTPVTAGVSGLPSWVSWGAIGGVLLLLMATARPVGKLVPRSESHR